MPNKIPREIWIIIILIPFIATAAKSLNNFFSNNAVFSWKDFWVQSFVGTVSGFLFGLLACWLTNGSQEAVGAISGFGAVAGIAGVARIAKAMEDWLVKKFK